VPTESVVAFELWHFAPSFLGLGLAAGANLDARFCGFDFLVSCLLRVSATNFMDSTLVSSGDGGLRRCRLDDSGLDRCGIGRSSGKVVTVELAATGCYTVKQTMQKFLSLPLMHNSVSVQPNLD